jgi:hypothetical protein
MNEQENNKLIAEFMGGALESVAVNFKEPVQGVFLHHQSQLQYHTSWDWLMPVVEKIKNNSYEDFTLEAIKVSPAYTLHACDIEATYKAVLEFINWYNQQAKHIGFND